jgi:hypothetical protein
MHEHEHHREEIGEKIERALQESALSVTIQMKYRQAIDAVLVAMTSHAIGRFHATVKEIRFYKTHSELTAAVRDKYPALTIRGVLKGCFDRDGTLHLNSGGKLFGRNAGLSEFYAHEITHAIDGNQHEISGSEKWQTAWKAEQDFLSENGKKTPSEGFAEFGEMLLGSGITREQMNDVLPMCLKVWEENQL